jgi:hypothetical protein
MVVRVTIGRQGCQKESTCKGIEEIKKSKRKGREGKGEG